MKYSRELLTGLFAILAIGLLVAGVNFLKGNSFFGGDDVYYAYFPNSAGVTPATSVYYNGVIVGKILEVELNPSSDPNKQVKITFNIQNRDFKIPKSAQLQAGGAENDFLGKGIIIVPNQKTASGFYKPGDQIQGMVSESIQSQIQAEIGPIKDNINFVLGNLDDFSKKLAAFWDTTASSEMEKSLTEVRQAIKKFGNAAEMINSMVEEERGRFSRIMKNVQEITENVKRSNDTVKAIIGDVKKLTAEFVTADFKGTIENAKNTLATVDKLLAEALRGEGTLGKLLGDDALYNELVETNKELQNLLNDLTVHPERYIHFSVFGAKTKGVPLTNKEEKELKEILKEHPDN